MANIDIQVGLKSQCPLRLQFTNASKSFRIGMHVLVLQTKVRLQLARSTESARESVYVLGHIGPVVHLPFKDSRLVKRCKSYVLSGGPLDSSLY